MRASALSLVMLALAGCAQAISVGAGSARQPVDALDQPLTAAPADPARGLAIVQGRDGNCLLCHAIPETGARFMGNLGPPLSGIGRRMTAGQLRLRLVDSLRLNPESIMPSYFRTDGLNQVAETWRGKTILTAQQIEDTIAYLLTLR